MSPASPVKQPKRRQTCDPCRKAKIKCDKRTPICGRCLATGDLCDYGISRQGAWWRHKGRTRSIQHDKIELRESPGALYLSPAHSESSSLTSSISPASSTNPLDQEATYDGEVGFNCFPGEMLMDDLYSTELKPVSSAGSYDSKNFTTGFHSPTVYGHPQWSSTSTLSQFTFPTHGIRENGNLHNIGATSPVATSEVNFTGSTGDSQQCPCFRVALQVLQALESSPPITGDRHSRRAAAESASILEINDRDVDCCWTVLRCKSCSKDYNKSPTVLLYTLVKKELLMLEQWLFACPMQSASNQSNMQLVDSMQDRSLKIGAGQIVLRRLKELLNHFGQTCQMINCDYTRLAHSFLVENLLIQLRSVSEKVNAEVNGPCLAIIRSIENIGVGLDGHQQ